MLSRILAKQALLRRFSGGHDPYLLHLEQQHDNYPQYAHLHWQTFDPLEVGKYAKQRSAAEFGNHVSEDPAPIEWFADLQNLVSMDRSTRDFVYSNFMRFESKFQTFLDENIDYAHEGDHSLLHGAQNVVLGVLEPEQIHKATEIAKNLVEEFKAAGLPYTREAVLEKVNLYLIKNLSKHQAHELCEGMMEYLEYFGMGNPLNED